MAKRMATITITRSTQFINQKNSGGTGTRTLNQSLKRRLLCQLSYTPKIFVFINTLPLDDFNCFSLTIASLLVKNCCLYTNTQIPRFNEVYDLLSKFSSLCCLMRFSKLFVWPM